MASSSEVARDWATGLRNARSKIERKVKELTKSPTESAAERSDVWYQKITQEETRRRFESGLRGVSLEDWRKKFLERGLSNMATGAEASVDKMTKFLDQLLPYAQSVKEKVKDMKVLTIDDAVAKAEAVIREMSKFRYKK